MTRLHSPIAALVLAGCTLHAQATPADAPAKVPAGILVVSNQQSHDASILALPAGTERRVAVGIGPHEAAIVPDARWGLVTVYGDRDSVGSRLAIVDLATGALVRHVSTGTYRRPHAAVPLPGAGHRVLVTSEATRNVVIVDLDQGRVTDTIPTMARASHMVVVTADGKRAFTANIADGSVSELDLEAKRYVRTIAVGQEVTEGIAITPDGREVWVGSNKSGVVSVIDTRKGEAVATLTSFKVPYRLGITRDGRTAAIVDPETNSVSFADVATHAVTGTVDLGASPRGVTFAPDGRTAFLTVVKEGGAGEAVVVDVGGRRVLARYAVGTAPDGIAYRP
jgi:DNA-binding beta-propeller fold protein YncE